jgi:hypothetical protein
MVSLKKIEDCKNSLKYVRLARGRGVFESFDRGYIIQYSTNFVLLQTTDDFTLNGYSIFPLDTIQKVRHNKNDSFYDKIMKREKLKDQIGIHFNIDLSNWKTIFQTLKKTKLTVTIECEEPHLDYFCIGSLQQVGKNKVSMLYFSPDGIIDETPTITEYVNITKVRFNDRYANVFTKYVKAPPRPRF